MSCEGRLPPRPDRNDSMQVLVPPGPPHNSGGKPPHLHTLPRLLTAPSNSRSVWSAPACWRCRRAALRPETSHPAPAFHKRPDGLLTRLDCPFEGRVPPRPDGNDSMKDPVPPGPRNAVEGIPPFDAVKHAPPMRDGMEAVPPLGGTRGLGRICPPCHASGRSGSTPAGKRCRNSLSQQWNEKPSTRRAPTVIRKLRCPVPPGARDAVEGVSPSQHGASGLAQRLECARLLALLQNASAPGDLLPDPHLPGRSTPDRPRCSPDDTSPQKAGLHPRAGEDVPEQAASGGRQRNSACGAACLPQPPRWPMASRKPKPALESVGSPQNVQLSF